MTTTTSYKCLQTLSLSPPLSLSHTRTHARTHTRTQTHPLFWCMLQYSQLPFYGSKMSGYNIVGALVAWISSQRKKEKKKKERKKERRRFTIGSDMKRQSVPTALSRQVIFFFCRTGCGQRTHGALRPQKPLKLIRDGEGSGIFISNPTRYTVTARIILH